MLAFWHAHMRVSRTQNAKSSDGLQFVYHLGCVDLTPTKQKEAYRGLVTCIVGDAGTPVKAYHLVDISHYSWCNQLVPLHLNCLFVEDCRWWATCGESTRLQVLWSRPSNATRASKLKSLKNWISEHLGIGHLSYGSHWSVRNFDCHRIRHR